MIVINNNKYTILCQEFFCSVVLEAKVVCVGDIHIPNNSQLACCSAPTDVVGSEEVYLRMRIQS